MIHRDHFTYLMALLPRNCSGTANCFVCERTVQKVQSLPRLFSGIFLTQRCSSLFALARVIETEGDRTSSLPRRSGSRTSEGCGGVNLCVLFPFFNVQGFNSTPQSGWVLEVLQMDGSPAFVLFRWQFGEVCGCPPPAPRF